MKKLIIISFLLLIGLNGFGQKSAHELDSISNEFIRELNKEGINNMIYYKNYCIGCIIENKPCEYQRPFYNSYLIWGKKNKSFIKKFDNCGSYNKVITTKSIMNFYESYKDTIKDEFIKDFTVKNIEGKDTSYLYLMIDHSGHSKIIMYDAIDTIYHHINYFNLVEKSGDNLNINYLYNKTLKLVELDLMIGKLIGKIYNSKKFIRDDYVKE